MTMDRTRNTGDGLYFALTGGELVIIAEHRTQRSQTVERSPALMTASGGQEDIAAEIVSPLALSASSGRSNWRSRLATDQRPASTLDGIERRCQVRCQTSKR
jgi:hypothetical protein